GTRHEPRQDCATAVVEVGVVEDPFERSTTWCRHSREHVRRNGSGAVREAEEAGAIVVRRRPPRERERDCDVTCTVQAEPPKLGRAERAATRRRRPGAGKLRDLPVSRDERALAPRREIGREGERSVVVDGRRLEVERELPP